MHNGQSLFISSAAAAELVRQASFAGSAGWMYLDLLEGNDGEGWLHLHISPGKKNGVPIARTDGITLYASSKNLNFFKGSTLNYYGDLSGGGFLISTPVGAESCSCGSGFRIINT